LKTPFTKRAGGMGQGVAPEFKPQYKQTTTTTTKRAGACRVAHVVKYLPSMCEALNSNPSTKKKKKSQLKMGKGFE
jgi:hypothetical protein